MKRIAIIGAGGHAKIIVDLINNLIDYEIIGFYDDNINKKLYNFKNLGNIKSINNSIDNYVIGIGDDLIRKNIYKNNKNLNYCTLIHPSSIISKNSKIGKGTVICAGSIIQTDVNIGKHCIINTNSNIDHECVIGDFNKYN